MNNTTLKNPKGDGINLQATLLNFWVNWPWFIVSILFFLTSTIIYLRYQVPVYNIKSTVLIKEQDNNKNVGNNTLSTMQEFGMLSMTNNFDNELQILKSQTIVRKVISDLGLYITQSEDRTFGYDTPLYQNEPIKVYMNPEEADKLEDKVVIDMTYTPDKQLFIKMAYTKNRERKETELSFKTFPTAFPTEIGVITFTPDTTLTVTKEMKTTVTITTPNGCAATYCAEMSV